MLTSSCIVSPGPTIHRLNQVGVQHFHQGLLPEANDCFLSAIKIMKRLSADGVNPAAITSVNFQQLLAFENECAKAPVVASEDWPKSHSYSKVLSPMFLCCSDFVTLTAEGDAAQQEPIDKYAWISYILIYNLAVVMHHQAMSAKQLHQGELSLQLFEQANGLYQCVYEGVTTREQPLQPLSKTVCQQQTIMGQRLLLSVLHNSGLLFEGAGDSNTKTEHCPAFRCFQLVFATLHSLRDYFGIERSDFPQDFDFDVVVATALDRFAIDAKGRKNAHHSMKTAPCA